MPRPLVVCILVVGLGLSVPGQVLVYVPDSSSSAGTCNLIPLGATVAFSSGYTYVARIPAASLDPANPVIGDVAFAPCGSGSWSSETVRIGFGHVPTPVPDPFTFPVGGLGSFLDYTEVVNGPFCWQANQDAWSPLRLGSGFIWNGVNDIAFFISFNAATVTGWGGTCHRTNTEPFRLYSAGYNAAASTASGAAGLKMRLSLQPVVHVPDGMSAVGTCNVIPFGAAATFSPGYSYVSRIPASSLSLASRVITDVAFAPCANGRWQAPQVRIGIGHVPTPMPSPFVFPVGGPGSFLDFREVVNGPFGFDANDDTWSSLHLGTNFVWNGVNDVAFYITFQNATVTGFSGNFHRATEPRSYAAGYNAAMSTTSNSPSALKICGITTSDRFDPDFAICVQAFATSAVTLRLLNVPPDTIQGFTFISLIPFSPAGDGPFFGIYPDPLVWSIVFTPPAPGSPFSWIAPVPGLFPSVAFSLPPGTMAPFSGLTWDFVGVALRPGFEIDGATNVAQVTWP